MKLLVDLHTHTVASGHAYSTITENAQAASNRGLKLLGMIEHGPSMPGAPDLYHFGNLSILPEELFGVKILPGVEANIINYEGELDMPLKYFWDRVGEFAEAIELVQETGISQQQILNTSPERVLDYLASRRKQRQTLTNYRLGIA